VTVWFSVVHINKIIPRLAHVGPRSVEYSTQPAKKPNSVSNPQQYGK